MANLEALSESVISGKVIGERISIPIVMGFSRLQHFRNQHFPVLEKGTNHVHTGEKTLIDNVRGLAPE